MSLLPASGTPSTESSHQHFVAETPAPYTSGGKRDTNDERPARDGSDGSDGSDAAAGDDETAGSG